ncbi:MAG: PaaI family thioesterase [Dehalococcoidia bacterium]
MSPATSELVAGAEGSPTYREFGVTVPVLEEERAVLSVPRESVRLRGVRDSINGGVVATLACAAARLLLQSRLGDEGRAGAATEIDIAYLSAARGSVTTFEARMLRQGGRVAVCEVEVRDTDDGTLNAKARVSLDIER